MCFIRAANKTKKGEDPRCTPQEPPEPCAFHELLLRVFVMRPAPLTSYQAPGQRAAGPPAPRAEPEARTGTATRA